MIEQTINNSMIKRFNILMFLNNIRNKQNIGKKIKIKFELVKSIMFYFKFPNDNDISFKIFLSAIVLVSILFISLFK